MLRGGSNGSSLGVSQSPLFTLVGGRAAHDDKLVVAGEWKEFVLYGNGCKYEEHCARCPATARAMEMVPAAMAPMAPFLRSS